MYCREGELFENPQSLRSKQRSKPTQEAAAWEDWLGSLESLDTAMADDGGWNGGSGGGGGESPVVRVETQRGLVTVAASGRRPTSRERSRNI